MSRSVRPVRRGALLALSIGLVLAFARTALALPVLTTLSTDPYTNTSSYHRTEVEPDSFSFGSTIVAAFQVGRFQDGGASNIGWATSTNGGSSWTNGFMPGLTTYSTPAGPWARSTDPSVAYDARHGVWMVSSLPLSATVSGVAVVVNRSTNGGLTWGNPVTVASATGASDFDKNWTACDNWPSSPYYGNCYTQWDDYGRGNRLKMSTSSDGGLTWTLATTPKNSVIGGQPLALPNGTVVVPIDNGSESVVESFVSTNGGASYSGPYTVASISDHTQAGGLRSGPLPSAEVDASGKVSVVWSDCRFRTSCSADDIVMSTSSNGTTWTAPVRIPIDATTSGVDHFLPGLAVDAATSGATAHLALVYHYYPSSSCTAATCQLDVGYTASSDGGTSWSAATQLAGPMTLGWLPNTSQGPMVGDYFSTSFSNGKAFPVFMNATSGSCVLGNVTSCNEYAVTAAGGLRRGGRVRAGTEAPVPGAHSDHATAGRLTSR